MQVIETNEILAWLTFCLLVWFPIRVHLLPEDIWIFNHWRHLADGIFLRFLPNNFSFQLLLLLLLQHSRVLVIGCSNIKKSSSSISNTLNLDISVAACVCVPGARLFLERVCVKAALARLRKTRVPATNYQTLRVRVKVQPHELPSRLPWALEEPMVHTDKQQEEEEEEDIMDLAGRKTSSGGSSSPPRLSRASSTLLSNSPKSRRFDQQLGRMPSNGSQRWVLTDH